MLGACGHKPSFLIHRVDGCVFSQIFTTNHRTINSVYICMTTDAKTV